MECVRVARALLLSTIPLAASAQTPQPIPIETAQTYFSEAQSLCQADHGHLWGVSLCGPIMFVDPQSRSIVASQADAKGLLKAEAGVFVGLLPTDQNIANTAVEWSGVYWTQMLWPLPGEVRQRETLISHELFHRIQNQLKLPKVEGGENAQLDTVDGRYYLQLEWRALSRALQASTDEERRKAAADAVLFRAERYRLFPGADGQEQALELNEGLAEYTGVRVGNPTAEEQIKAALNDLSSHRDDSTFVRSFAYATGPGYGLLLDRYLPGWHDQLKPDQGFGALLRNALHIALPENLQLAAERRATQYDGTTLRAAETERETRRQQLVAGYHAKFIDGPVLTLQFRNMQVQFDPRNLQPLGDAGTVYPNLRISDDWGILDAKNGALMKPDWSAVIVVAPLASTGSSLKGDGWTLELKPGWKIVLGTRKGDFILVSGS
ncbi:MAG: hypothetical protein WCA20_29780 [Candidatus Sulfotelmatobacter sp.]